jgi:ferric-dicitrate binding protein FerR (iron transport regulator)
MSLAMRLSRSHPDSGQADLDELKVLEERKRALEEQIQSMSAEPEKILREAQEQAATLPPPDDLADRRRLREFEEIVSRRQVRNERRTQGRSLLLLFLLLAATAALAAWVVKLFVA